MREEVSYSVDAAGKERAPIVKYANPVMNISCATKPFMLKATSATFRCTNSISSSKYSGSIYATDRHQCAEFA